MTSFLTSLLQPPSAPLIPPNLPSPFADPMGFTLGMLRSSPYIFFEALKYALPASIFFFKFLEWWYSPDNTRRRQRRGHGGGGSSGGGQGEDEDGFNLAPPKVFLPHADGVVYHKADGYKEVPIARTRLGLAAMEEKADGATPSVPAVAAERKGLLHNGCPICGAAPINNPTLFPSGYAACYTCAFAYVDEHACCPVTLQDVGSTAELRRVLG